MTQTPPPTFRRERGGVNFNEGSGMGLTGMLQERQWRKAWERDVQDCIEKRSEVWPETRDALARVWLHLSHIDPDPENTLGDREMDTTMTGDITIHKADANTICDYIELLEHAYPRD